MVNFCKTVFLFILLILIALFGSNAIENLSNKNIDYIKWKIDSEFKKAKNKGETGPRGRPAANIVKGTAPRATKREMIQSEQQ